MRHFSWYRQRPSEGGWYRALDITHGRTDRAKPHFKCPNGPLFNQVTIEVQGLVQRRSVSSRLQSHGFRRSLENVFRTHFTARPSALAQRRRADSRPTPEERAEPNSVNNVPVISNDRLETSEPAAPTAESTTTGTTTVHRFVLYYYPLTLVPKF